MYARHSSPGEIVQLPVQLPSDTFYNRYRPSRTFDGPQSRSLLDSLQPVYHRELNTAKLSKRHLMIPQNLSGIMWLVTLFAEIFSGTLPKWLAGIIAEVTGTLLYVVTLSDGVTVRRHVDSIRRRDCAPTTTPMGSQSSVVALSVPITVQSSTPPSQENSPLLDENVSAPS